MEPEGLATAHQAWDAWWTSDRERSKWSQPDPLVQAMVPRLQARGLRRVLDLGCGIGRHAHYLAGQAFECVGIDASEAGLAFARERAAADSLAIEYRRGTFYELGAFADRTFDAVVAWNVIYHGDGDVAQRAVNEIQRVLVPGGLFVGTLLSKRNAGYGVGREVRPDTFVVDDSETDKAHPHFYCEGATLMRMHRGFEVLELRDREQAPGANHWEFVFERR
jgi:tellurite methyltransferase